MAACPDPAAIRAISVDTTGSTVCFTDAEGMPLSLRPEFADDPDAMFVLWKDHTGTAEAEEFTAAGARYTPNYTCQSGNHYSAECTWAKVLHILRTNAAQRSLFRFGNPQPVKGILDILRHFLPAAGHLGIGLHIGHDIVHMEFFEGRAPGGQFQRIINFEGF